MGTLKLWLIMCEIHVKSSINHLNLARPKLYVGIYNNKVCMINIKSTINSTNAIVRNENAITPKMNFQRREQ